MIGERIRKRINDLNAEKKDVAQLVGCTEITLGRIIRNNVVPPYWLLHNLAKVLGVTEEWLVYGYPGKPVKIRIKYHDGVEHLKKISIGDWIDLRSAEEVHLRAGDEYYISLGVSMELPDGYEAIVAPRSSTLKQFGLICGNSFGIIDNSFKGDNDVWKFAAYAVRDTWIRKGDRICQFRIQKNQPAIEFEEVEILGNSDRGGYGSTGRN